MSQIDYEEDYVCSLHRFSGFTPKTNSSWGYKPTNGWKTLPDFINDFLETMDNKVDAQARRGGFWDIPMLFEVWLDQRKSSFIMCVTVSTQTVAEKHFKELVAKHGWTSVTSLRPGDSSGDLTIWLTTLGQFEGMCKKIMPKAPPKPAPVATKVIRKGKKVMNKVYRGK